MTKDLIEVYKDSNKDSSLYVCAAFMPAKLTSVIVQHKEKSYFKPCQPDSQSKVTYAFSNPLKLTMRITD
jgi:hypothetical protein